MEPRQLILHAGAPKTGSSALQVAFARNEVVLKDLEVHYPGGLSSKKALKGRPTSGNAVALARFLSSGSEDLRAEAIASLDQSLGHGEATTLLSAESLYFAKPGPLAEIRQLAESRGVTVSAVIYVRDIVPWTLSRYTQHVQRNRMTSSLADFVHLQADSFQLTHRIGAFVDALGQDRVRLIHYDTVAPELITHFFADVLGWSAENAPVRQPGIVNRSLTQREVAWMREVNRVLASDRGVRVVGETLLKREPSGSSRVSASEEEIALLTSLFSSDLAWLNQTFFEGRPVVGLGLASTDAIDDPEPPLTASELDLISLCCDLADRIASTSAPDDEARALRKTLISERQRRRRLERELKVLRAGAGTPSTPPTPGGPLPPRPFDWLRSLRTRR